MDGVQRDYLRAYLLKVDQVDNPVIAPDFSGTREDHLRSTAKKNNQPIDTVLRQNIPLSRSEAKKLKNTLSERATKPAATKRIVKKKIIKDL